MTQPLLSNFAAWRRRQLLLLRIIWDCPQLLGAAPSLNLFMARYLGKFTPLPWGRQWIVHSHLPPIGSPSYGRFVRQHLLAQGTGPSHAQISLTNRCPQHCRYCYNKGRQGELLTTAEIIAAIASLRELGVCWLGLTGGEPLEHPDLLRIVASVGPECALKLFTTGSGVTLQQAAELRQAGLDYVSVSLDHFQAEHDRVRGCAGAYQSALAGIKIFQEAGLHVSVSAVISRQMLEAQELPDFLAFLAGLGVQEAWLSESKPALPHLWQPEEVITQAQRRQLVALQDRYNRRGRMTVNYLGHFEGPEHFGCNAGHKMLYVDAFGQVSPCVFVPLAGGDVRREPLAHIWQRMQGQYPGEGECFINRNYPLLQKYYRGQLPLDQAASQAVLAEVSFSPPAEFARRQSHGGKASGAKRGDE